MTISERAESVRADASSATTPLDAAVVVDRHMLFETVLILASESLIVVDLMDSL